LAGFLGQNEIHSDLMSWPCVHVRIHVRVNFSLNIFFSETTTPRELIFGRNVPWVVLFKIFMKCILGHYCSSTKKWGWLVGGMVGWLVGRNSL
jgi:hypothetical protein